MDILSPSRQKLVVAAILCLFLSLGTIYSVVDPIFESSDELSHYPYVKYMADGRGLPVQRPGEETLWDQEGSQPPLYYALAAALTSWINTDDLPIVRRINPHSRLGVPLAQENKNMIIHTAREEFPWSGTVLAVHLIRLFSLLLSAGTVFCTYRLASVLFPQRPSLALSAMAMNAFIPMFLFISASVNNDNLVVLLCSLTLLCLVRVLQRGASFVQWVGVGIPRPAEHALPRIRFRPVSRYTTSICRSARASAVSGTNPRALSLVRQASPIRIPIPTDCTNDAPRCSTRTRHSRVREQSKTTRLSLLTEALIKRNMGMKAFMAIALKARDGRSGKRTEASL